VGFLLFISQILREFLGFKIGLRMGFIILNLKSAYTTKHPKIKHQKPYEKHTPKRHQIPHIPSTK
jgi:hypothetical protein